MKTPDPIARKPRGRRMARKPETVIKAEIAAPVPPGKLDRLEALLCEPDGTNLANLMAATGWQAHSVRGALAGALRRRGLIVSSEKVDGVRRYRGTRNEA